jgi:hypothetical protein
MIPRILIFALHLWLLAAAIGCKDSPRAVEPAPVVVMPKPPVPKPNPVLPKAVLHLSPYAPPPDLATMVPVRTFQVTPTASFTRDQLSEGSAVVFEVPANAGQLLSVAVSEARVRVQAPGAGTAVLEHGGDSEGHWLYALPRTGTYRILFAPVRDPNIKFAFLASDDPRVDPGIKPEQFSVDFGAFAQPEQLAVVPYSSYGDGAYMDEWPTHLGVQSDQFDFHVMTVAGYKEVFKKDQSMDVLATALAKGEKGSKLKGIIYSVYRDEGINMATQPGFFEGEGWHGRRWIGGFGQDTSCDPDLGYIFEGLSNDGRYFILMRAIISSPAAQKRFSADCDIKLAVSRDPKIDALFDRDMTTAAPGSFQPNLEHLDAVIRSLKFRR